ncbi:tryptophan-rich sensory protein [bacterium]|nr:tryptophan-rich sensory protein [bacterium]
MFNYDWYKTLIQPPLAPPGWLFAPVWTVLYITMLISLFIYAITPSVKDKSWGCVLFFLQFVLNLVWTPIFFGMMNIGLALVVIILLDVLVIWNIVEFCKVSKKAGLLLIPYLVWILFATYLNAGIFVLN